MPVTLFSAAVCGLEAFRVSVEVDLLPGLPSFTISGLGDTAVHEARDRIRSAIRHSGFRFPIQKKIINLAPARVRKHGATFDLPMALGLLAASGQIPASRLRDFFFFGELSLDGMVQQIPGVLPMVHFAKQEQVQQVVVPLGNAEEASLVPGVDIFPVGNVREATDVLLGKRHRSHSASQHTVPKTPDAHDIFSLIKGHDGVKRGLEVAAAGFHSVLLVGPPGTGKTILAEGVRSLLPPMTMEEIVRVTAVYSVAGLLTATTSVMHTRPFRSVHATASVASLLGGGSGNPKPGELSLAHRGVFFLDEIGEVERHVLDALRQPLETHQIILGRMYGISSAVTFPADMLFLGAMNPCPCGFRDDLERKCHCSSSDLLRYQRKLSGPFLDRIDLMLHVPRISFEELTNQHEKHQQQELERRTRIARAWQIQQGRFGRRVVHNSQIPFEDIDRFCTIPSEASQLLKKAMDRFHLSPRAYHRILKVARTIADLEGREAISVDHVAEAMQYRVQLAFQ